MNSTTAFSIRANEMAKLKGVELLKMKSDELRQRIEANDDKIDRLSTILRKKNAASIAATGTVIPAELRTVAIGELKVSHFRLPARSSKSLPNLDPKTDSDSVPISLNSQKMIDINIKHIKRTKAKFEVKNVIKSREEEKQAKEIKSAPRKYPSIAVPESFLPNRYIRGELPCTIEHGTSGHYLSWACPLDNLDYEYYLPIFFDGLQCKEQPACFLARQGVEDMLYACRGKPERLLPVIKLLVRPIRNALSKFDPELVLGVTKAIRQLLKSNPTIGEPLMVYSKQFLAPLAAFVEMEKNLGDGIDYAQRKNDDIGEECRLALEMLEECGGPKATRQIQFSIPTYQSVLKKFP